MTAKRMRPFRTPTCSSHKDGSPKQTGALFGTRLSAIFHFCGACQLTDNEFCFAGSRCLDSRSPAEIIFWSDRTGSPGDSSVCPSRIISDFVENWSAAIEEARKGNEKRIRKNPARGPRPSGGWQKP